MVATTPPDPFDVIVDAPFDSALSERYLVYALSNGASTIASNGSGLVLSVTIARAA